MPETFSTVSELNAALVATSDDFLQLNPGIIDVDTTLTINGKIVYGAGQGRTILRWRNAGEFNAVNLLAKGELHSCTLDRDRPHPTAGASRIAVVMTSTDCQVLDTRIQFPSTNPAGRVYNGVFLAGTGNAFIDSRVDKCYLGAGIRMNAATRGKLDGCIVASGTGAGLTIDGACADCLVRNSLFRDNATEGMEVAQCARLTVSRCQSLRNGEEGFEFKTLNPIQITDLLVERCLAANSAPGFTGFVFTHAGTPPGGSVAIDRFTVRDCTARNNGQDGFAFGWCRNGVIEQNVAHGNGGWGLQGGTTNTLIMFGPQTLSNNATGNLNWEEG